MTRKKGKTTRYGQRTPYKSTRMLLQRAEDKFALFTGTTKHEGSRGIKHLGDAHYTKMWSRHFLNALESAFRSPAVLAFTYLIEHRDRSTNIVKITQRELARRTKVSPHTIWRLFVRLTKETTPPFLRRISPGKYQINPDVLFAGSFERRKEASEMFAPPPASKTPREKVTVDLTLHMEAPLDKGIPADARTHCLQLLQDALQKQGLSIAPSIPPQENPPTDEDDTAAREEDPVLAEESNQ